MHGGSQAAAAAAATVHPMHGGSQAAAAATVPPMHGGSQAAAAAATVPPMHGGSQAAAAATFPPMHGGSQAAAAAAATVPPMHGGSQAAAAATVPPMHGGSQAAAAAATVPPMHGGSQAAAAATFPPMHGGSQAAAAATVPPMHGGSQAAGVSTFPPMHVGLQAAGVSTPSHMSSMSKQDFRSVLRDIAKNMRTDEQTDNLGMELGIDQADIDGYKKANRHGIDYEGTHDMLKKWSMNQQPATRLGILRQALETVKRIDLCESLSSKPDVVDMGTTSTAAAIFPPMHAGVQVARVSTPSQIDLESDEVLDTLSKHVPHKTYTTLCRHLGIGYDQANSILAKCIMDYQRATRECLAQWKTRTGGDMAQLKTILVAAELTNLVKYVN
eukprot:XP_011669560.1 PREDICTED: uncharacterized protein LOC105440756 [Strongylocentrotus purpuratus]